MKYLTLLIILLFSIHSEAQVAVAVEGMNVLFPVVENPITLVVTDIPDSNLVLIPSMGEIHRKEEPGKYGWTICHRDTNFAILTIRDQRNDSLVEKLFFRVKQLPLPTPMVGKRPKSNIMPNGEYKRQGGLALVLINFDFELKCDVVYFDVQYITEGSDALVKRNYGARWNSDVQDLINKAKPGDQYNFYHITYKCGCDPMVRYLSNELYTIIK